MTAEKPKPPASVLNNLGYSNRELFEWLWGELKTAEPSIGCEKKQRYIGLYTSEMGRRLFARIDNQRGGLFIGVEKAVLDRLKPQTFVVHHFAEWKTGLRGLLLAEKNPEIVEILTAAYRARIGDYSAIQSLESTSEAVKKLLPKVVRDIESFDAEEARFEGSKKERYSNYYERVPELRAKAIVIHGTVCMVAACRFDFGKTYGRRGKDYIEVHHLRPLSSTVDGAGRNTDPRRDMVVVCANCHRMIHRRKNEILSLGAVSTLIERASQRT